MPGGMSSADLVADLKASLHDSGKVFTAAGDADFLRFLDQAALDFSSYRQRTLVDSIILEPDIGIYQAPADLIGFNSSTWGSRRAKPWEPTWTGRLPCVRVVENSSSRWLLLDPAPTAQQILILGSTYRFFYYARHLIENEAGETTIQPGDRGLLLLRAQAEACKEMAMRNLTKPVSMRDGISNAPRNGTPSYLFEVLMREYKLCIE